MLLSLGFLIGAFIVYASFLGPEYQEANTLRGTLASKTELYDTNKKILDDIQDLLARYQGSSRLQETVSMVLPAEADTGSIYHQIYVLARTAGLELKTVSVGIESISAAKAETAFLPVIGTLSATVEILGPYEGIKNFFRLLETNIRLMDLVSFGLRAPSQDKPNEFTANIAFRTYYQTENKGRSAPAR